MAKKEFNAEDFNYDKVESKVERLDAFLWKKYHKLGDGGYRSVFELNDEQVIKCPLVDSCYEDPFDNGIRANLIEYYFYERYKKLNIMPKTELIWKRGIPLVIMEKVEVNSVNFSESQEFFEYLKKNGIELWDGDRQLGKTVDGKVVSYDLGNENENLSERINAKIDRMTLEIYDRLSQKRKNRKRIQKSLTSAV
jgi:hypothetical protein